MNTAREDVAPMTHKMGVLAKALAVIALVAGLGMGLYALAAALGVWLGLWDFRRGFDMLRLVNENAGLIALLCLGITVIVAVLVWRLKLEKGSLLTMALIGTVAAALAYFVPESYRPAEGSNIPPIHDITTDTANPPQFVDVLALRGPGTNTTVYGSGGDMTPERLSQLQREAYPDIQPVVIDAPADAVFQRALDTVEELGWDLVAQVPEEGRIEATDTTFWFRFKDDVVIRIEEGPQGTIVNARSVSRVGVSDVGKNAERLREFFSALQQR